MSNEDYKTVHFGLSIDSEDVNEQIEKLKKEGYSYIDTVFNEFDTSYGYHIYQKPN